MERTTRPRVFVTRQHPGDVLAWLAARVTPEVWEEQLPPLQEVLLATLTTSRWDEALLAGASMAADNLLAGLEGRPPPHRVHPELFP